ncbi:MAG: Uma2 family endonuclease [Ktedonobacterales bacterium]|nr:Uma2 family endonuclease [Ktedonobacterales bacterium]
MAAPQPTWGDVYEVPATTTADDLLRLPDDGSKNELYEGMLVREMTSPGHGAICHRFSVALGIYAGQQGFTNAIVQNALFDLTPPDATRKTVLAPDLAILRGSAAPSWDVPREIPLLAIEVVSPSQTLLELALKAQFYRAVGVEEVWVVDATSRSIEVWNAQGRTLLGERELLTSSLLPGFSVAISFLLDG